MIGGNLRYDLKLALKNMRRNPVLSALMIAAIGIGVGISMSMITINYVMSSNPIPRKSDRLFYVQLDSWSADFPFNEGRNPPTQLTYLDATALMRAGKAFRQAVMSRSSLAVEPADPGQRPFFVQVRATYRDFFPMFDVPFKYGQGWTAEADDKAEQVVVLSAETNERVFGGENSVGRTLRLSGQDYRVVGVMDDWKPLPKFYDPSSGALNEAEDAFIPWSLIVAKQLPRNGNTNCWKPIVGSGLQAFLNSECIWIQFWVELRNDAEKAAYHDFLDAYVMEQKELGRFPRPLDNRLSDVMQWLDEIGAVPPEAKVLLGLSLIFLVVCLLNTVGLLLAKFLGRAPEIGVRRALGASRGALFRQHLVESGLVGVAGGLLGIGFAWLCLKGIDAQFEEQPAALMAMDWVMVLTAVALAIAASLATAVFPTWRSCSVQPAVYLKAN